MEKTRLLLVQVLKEALPDHEIERIKADFPQFLDTRLSSLGVDSLSFFSVIGNIETICGRTIDYANINLDELNTLRGIFKYLGVTADAY